jgi:hypothetical protein
MEVYHDCVQWWNLILVSLNLWVLLPETETHDSSVGIVLGYGLDDRSSRVRFLVGAGNFSLHHLVHSAHPSSYPMGTRGSFLGGKLASN